jgi:hypothetical protein
LWDAPGIFAALGATARCIRSAEEEEEEEEEIYICSSRLGLIKMVTATREVVETVS